LFITTGLSTGGAEVMLYKLLSRMDRAKFDPAVISLADGGPLRERIDALGVPVFVMGMKRGRLTLRGLWSFIRTVRELNPDLIQGWMIHGNLAAVVAGGVGRKALVWGVRHSRLPSDTETRTTVLLDRLLAWLSFAPRKIIYNSRAGQIYHESIGYIPSKGTVIPNGFDAGAFVPSDAARRKLRAELGVPETTFLIGMIGRYHPMKGHDIFIRAAAHLVDAYPSMRFVLAGSGCDSHNAALHSLMQELSLRDAVYLLGERADVAAVTAALDIATSASAAEGFANVIGEAMCCGVPCVVTDVGDSAWLVDETGVVVSPGDPRALSRGWAQVIEMGHTGRHEVGHRARQRIIEEFSLEGVVRQYEAVYAELVG